MKTNPSNFQSYFDSNQQWSDRQWFDERPARTYRMRQIDASELQTLGCNTHVVVRKVNEQERMRVAITLLAIPPKLKVKLESAEPYSPKLDAVLSGLFAALASGRSVELGRFIRNSQAFSA